MLSKFNSEKYVAHYTSLDTVIKHIMPTNKIRLSSIELLNDPYENTVDWLEFEANIKENSFIENHQNSLDFTAIKEKIKRNIKFFSTTSFTEASENTTDISNDIYCRPRMWAQYGDNNQGICLIFDKQELNKEFENFNKIGLIAGKIQYIDFISIINSDINVNLGQLKLLLNDSDLLFNTLNSNQYLSSRFLRKHKDWESENEYRWLVFTKDETELYINFKLSLKAIVFGSKVHDNYKICLDKFSVPKYVLSFKDGKYKAELL